MERFQKFAQSLLLITLSLFLILLGYVVFNSEFFPRLEQDANFTKEVSEYPSDWVYYYGDIDVDECYPIVALRSGYKIIREDEDELIIGWKYELVNTIEENLNVSVTFKILDSDGFLVCKGNSSKLISSKSYDYIQDTFTVSAKEKSRLARISWRISPGEYSTENLQKYRHNRFVKCAEIMFPQKNDYCYPFWLTEYLKFYYCRTEPSCIKDGEGHYKTDVGKWAYLANKLDVKPLDNIEAILDKLHISSIEIPQWQNIKESEEYISLPQKDKETLKKWLRYQRDYSSYDPQVGKFFDLSFLHDEFSD